LAYRSRGWDRVIHATSGVLSVSIDGKVWVLPSHQALWVPDAHQAVIHIVAPARLRCAYLREKVVKRLPPRCTVLSVSPLLEAILEVCAKQGALLARKSVDRRLAAVFYDQLQPAAGEPLEVPEPTHPEAQRFAQLLRAAPLATPLSTLARQFGASLRTLERLFEADLRCSLAAWRRRLRLQKSLELLALRKTVSETAHLCGYASASAFIAMFRREFGVSPARYFRAPGSEVDRHHHFQAIQVGPIQNRPVQEKSSAHSRIASPSRVTKRGRTA
jgi:AraC-like DNA-binding protein